MTSLTHFPACATSGSTAPIKGASWTGRSRRWAGRSAWSSAPPAGSGFEPTRSRPRRQRASRSCPGAGSLRAPSHNTLQALLTSTSPPAMIGRTGLLNLLRVVTRLHAAQDRGSQESGAPCLSSPLPPPAPFPSSPPALPPAHDRASVQPVGASAACQSPAAAAGVRPARQPATECRRSVPAPVRRGGAS